MKSFKEFLFLKEEDEIPEQGAIVPAQNPTNFAANLTPPTDQNSDQQHSPKKARKIEHLKNIISEKIARLAELSTQEAQSLLKILTASVDNKSGESADSVEKSSKIGITQNSDGNAASLQTQTPQ
jgi:hypothetical protein